MGNFYHLEMEFIQRTLALLDQYDELKEGFPFEQQYNHTLLTNCLLGLVVLPKEKIFDHITDDSLETLNDYGLVHSYINPGLGTTRVFFRRLRNAVAHFGIEFLSETPDFLIDKIKFTDVRGGIVIAIFTVEEFPVFIRFFAQTLLTNMAQVG
ncbi:MAG: hypothetical protein BGO52_07240 [Sphingobacteriales bacterium 44-61]|nr:MAG: hypothetical protein BGO52_07240 [Sphingobacteriales bacterium 44-61]